MGAEFFVYARELMRAVDTILFGRVTYEMIASYWPTAATATENAPVITQAMNTLPKIVVSRTLKTLSGTIRDWPNEMSAEKSRN